MMKVKKRNQMTIEELDAMVNAKYLEYHQQIDLKSFRWVNEFKIVGKVFFFLKNQEFFNESHAV